MKKSINTTTKQIRNALALSFENAIKCAEKNAAGYIKFNPGDADRRNWELEIEKIGINNLYYRMLAEVEWIEKNS